MRIGPFKFATRKSTAVLVVAAFALRALIPSGFMLDSGHRLAIVICPDGFPADLLPQGNMDMSVGMSMSSASMSHGDVTHESMPRGNRHAAGHFQSDHCLFTSGSSSGPVLHFAGLASNVQIVREAMAMPERLAAPVRFVYVPQPRAPPNLT